MTNLQGDVIKILNASGSTVATYSYDAWGKLLDSSGSMADINPIRYRGYYYDTDTQLYYLQSRYYDPQIARFINGDNYASTGQGVMGTNMFVYCGNNPVCSHDSFGNAWTWIFATALVSCVIGIVSKVVSNYISGKPANEGSYGAGAGGLAFGATLAVTKKISVASYAGAATESVVNEVVSYTPFHEHNGAEKKELTTENVVNSIVNVASNTVIDGSLANLTGNIANVIVPTNPGWFTPKKIISCFFGRYAIKSELQTIIQGGETAVISIARNLFEGRK